MIMSANESNDVDSRRALLASGIALFFPEIAKAAGIQFSQLTTMGFPNGRYWKILDKAQSTGYLLAIENGLSWLGSLLGDKATDKATFDRVTSAIKANYPSQMTRTEVCDTISNFYADPTNARIPIVLLLPVVTLKEQGMNPLQIENLLATLRKNVADQQ